MIADRFYKRFCQYVFNDSVLLKYLTCLTVWKPIAPKPSGTENIVCS